MYAFLIRVDSEENMNRWYLVFIQATLLEPIAVMCMWGSRDTAYQQTKVTPVATLQEAEILAEKIVKDKIKRGYILQQN